MFKQIDGVLSPAQLAELHRIADGARFVDGRISNPHNTSKQNLHINDQQAQQRSSQIMAEALYAHEEFRNYAFPKVIAPPLITAYRPGMRYGLHADAAFMQIGPRRLRSDLSCTIFLSPLDSYEGGALRIQLGSHEVLVRAPAGSLILYPSTTLHEVTPVTRGERRVGLTFIESRIADPERREWLYELNEVAALEGLGMSAENFTRLQRVQQNLLRAWSDHD
ncbi:MAG TPA: Fe2+-dependent dioxygenase [Sphingomonas sp.]|nr:Fe2+-dependent dioxygenase [Sphingomonas sp.]